MRAFLEEQVPQDFGYGKVEISTTQESQYAVIKSNQITDDDGLEHRTYILVSREALVAAARQIIAEEEED